MKFELRKSPDAVKILDCTNVQFVDGSEDDRPIKCIMFQVSSGNVAEVIVERYLMAKDKDGNDISTLNDKNKECLLTHKECYYVEAEGLDNVIINVRRANAI